MEKDFERLRQLRKHFKMSQTEFAERLGVTRSVIKNLELGVVEIKDHMYKLIAATFSASEEWLRNGTGDMFVKTKSNILDELVTAHGLNEREKAIVAAFLDLTPEGRAGVIEYIEKASNNLAGTPSREDIIAGDIAATQKKIIDMSKTKA